MSESVTFLYCLSDGFESDTFCLTDMLCFSNMYRLSLLDFFCWCHGLSEKIFFCSSDLTVYLSVCIFSVGVISFI